MGKHRTFETLNEERKKKSVFTENIIGTRATRAHLIDANVIFRWKCVFFCSFLFLFSNE